jgi:phosphohistidine phosphatase
MLLYIVRHAYAGERGDPRYPDDSLRPVTKKGRKQFDRLVKRLVKRGLAASVIGSSPYMRCMQTAEVLADRLEESVPVQAVEAFAPGCQVDGVLAWAKQCGAQKVAYVGHAPDVDLIAAALLGAADESVHLAKGAIAAIELTDELAAGKGALRWLVTPKLVG